MLDSKQDTGQISVICPYSKSMFCIIVDHVGVYDLRTNEEVSTQVFEKLSKCSPANPVKALHSDCLRWDDAKSVFRCRSLFLPKTEI